MAFLDERMTVGANSATGRSTSVSGTRTYGTGATGDTATEKSADFMGVTANAGVALIVGADGATTGVASARAHGAGVTGATGTLAATTTMLTTTAADTALTTGTAKQEDKKNGNQANIILNSHMDNLIKELNKTPIYEYSCLDAQFHAFIL